MKRKVTTFKQLDYTSKCQIFEKSFGYDKKDLIKKLYGLSGDWNALLVLFLCSYTLSTKKTILISGTKVRIKLSNHKFLRKQHLTPSKIVFWIRRANPLSKKELNLSPLAIKKNEVKQVIINLLSYLFFL